MTHFTTEFHMKLTPEFAQTATRVPLLIWLKPVLHL